MPLSDKLPIRTALISVSDKTGLEPLARELTARGVRLFSTGGTYAHLTDSLGLAADRVEDLTKFPEMMDGRVKTLHPKVFGGILARRGEADDLHQAEIHGIPLFDLVVVNLYPFWGHLGKPVEAQVPYVDIGGPSMLRAAAKNHEAVAVLSDPADYGAFIDELSREKGSTTKAFRVRQAARTFQRTAAYDSLIASQWSGADELPLSLPLTPQSPLRYGENPHQKAAWCGSPGRWKVLQGKELSYNNLLDAEAALRLVEEFTEPAVAIIKHNNPCGVASGNESPSELFARALATDSKSAFGGIIAWNRSVDETTAIAMSALFLEVIIARGFEPGALEVLSKKKNLRLIEWEKPFVAPVEVRAALGGWLLQQTDVHGVPAALTTVTQRQVPESAWNDLRFAWRVAKHVRSNAIVLAKGGTTIGIGAGQMSRVDAVTIALQKSPPGSLKGAVLASDAFFPFRDNIDLLKDIGIAAVIQPGGSQRDAEVIEACEAHGIALVFTGQRHFRH